MRCTISQIYFAKELYMFQTDLLSIIRGFNTIHRMELGSILTSEADSHHNYHDIYLLLYIQC